MLIRTFGKIMDRFRRRNIHYKPAHVNLYTTRERRSPPGPSVMLRYSRAQTGVNKDAKQSL